MITAELSWVRSYQVSERLVAQQGTTGVVYKLSKLVHLTLVPKNIKQKIAILSRKWMLKIKMKRSGSKAR